ncbi:MAG: CehA/McbA family metallohydrolase [Deltaproteobacteria bacterium]|nr:CehA/McbA family metallohydrolase [Deltaproteobacteria bacterium]
MNITLRALVCFVFVCSGGMLACGDGGDKPADESQDAGISDTGTMADTGGPADAGSGDIGNDGDAGQPPLDLTVPMGPGEVRAGRITRDDELIGGALPKGQVGDFKIYNSKIRVVIEGARPSDGWGVYGGTIADADIVRAPEDPGQGLFGEYFFGFGVRLLDPESVEAINDGGEGQPAVIRAVGPDKGLPFIETTPFGQVLEDTPLETTITTDYVLAPDSDVLEVRTSFAYGGKRPVDLVNNFHAFFMGDGLKYFATGSGFDAEAVKNKLPLVVLAGNEVSYGFFGEDGDMTVLLRYEGMVFSTVADLHANPKEVLEFRRFIAIGGGGADSVLRAYNKWAGTAGLGRVAGKVLAADGVTPVPGARIHVLDNAGAAGKNHATQTVAGADGASSVEVPAGEYRLVPFADGHDFAAGEAVTVSAGQDAARDLVLPGAGAVEFAVTGDGGAAMPAKLAFDRHEGRVVPGPGFGEQVWDSGHQWVAYSATGSGRVELPAGTYTVTVGRGFEYEINEQDFALATGQTVGVQAALARAVDTIGYVSSDFHIHALASPDSDVPFTDRVASAAAEGVEAPVATEHDFIKDWTPAAEVLGVTGWVHPIVGSEITTYVYGHFNAWPLVPAPAAVNDGAFVWYEKMAPELLAEMAAYPGQPVVQVNHPRTQSIGGYFSAVGYDRAAGSFEKPDNWSEQFDLIEIINGGGIDTALKETLPDWYSFLNRGHRFVGSSGSDVHDLLGSVGTVRNWIASGTDSPGAFDVLELARNSRAMKMIVSTGPFVTASIGGKTFGEVAAVSGGQVDLAIKVQAPSWMDVNTLKVVANGEEVHVQALDDTTADPQNPVVRFDGVLPFTPAADTWYVVLVSGDRGREPVQSARSFAFTNPIFADVDGNGAFDAPVK